MPNVSTALARVGHIQMRCMSHGGTALPNATAMLTRVWHIRSVLVEQLNSKNRLDTQHMLRAPP